MKFSNGPRGHILGAATLIALLGGAGAAFAFGDPSPEQRAALEGTDAPEAEGAPLEEVTIWDGVFTEEQAAAGRAVYATNCATCHGPAARGAPGMPSLVGATLNRKYADMPLSVYFDYMMTNMPRGREGSLQPQQYADIMAFILTAHGVEPGDNTLTADPALLESIIIGPRPE